MRCRQIVVQCGWKPVKVQGPAKEVFELPFYPNQYLIIMAKMIMIIMITGMIKCSRSGYV